MTESERQVARYQWLKTADVAAICGGVSLAQVYGWLDDGELEAIDVRSKDAKQPDWRFRQDAVDAFLTRRSNAAA
jgi:hypothetical protein